MNRGTRRRALLGGLVTAAVGGTGYYLTRRTQANRWLEPASPVADHDAFAFVVGVVEPDGTTMDLEFALYDRSEEGRNITVFPDTDQPIDGYLPPLRGFWRLSIDVAGRPSGTYALRVGSHEIAVELAETPPARYADGRVQLSPESTWQSDYVAYAGGFGHGDGTGRLAVVFRRPAGGAPNPLDAVGFRDGRGRLVGKQSISQGARSVSFELDPLVVSDADGSLVEFWNDERLTNVDLFYH